MTLEELLTLLAVMKKGPLEEQYKLFFLLVRPHSHHTILDVNSRYQCENDSYNRIQMPAVLSLVATVHGRWFAERSDIVAPANVVFDRCKRYSARK